ncbi:MAG: copper resistance protein CopC [Rhodospirillaceae bacterium]|nr:copper resistance protein CopC [Rhodospirillaceae bacterium]
MKRARIYLCHVVAALLSIFAANGALAHAVLMGSSPKSGEMLAQPPKELTLTFNENVGPIFFKILDKTGKEVGNPGEIKMDGYSLILPLNDQLPNGTYVLTYRVISADTHPVGMTFGFSVGEPMADMSQMSAGAESSSTPWTYAVAGNRWLLYATMLLAAGSAFFTLMVKVPTAVGAAAFGVGRTSAIIAMITYVLAIGLGGAEMVMGGGGALFAADTWSRGLSSTLTPSAAIGVPAMLILIYAFGKGAESPKTGALLVGSAAAVASFLVTGHAATAPPVWLMATMVAVHLFCAAFWFGALYPLQRSTTAVDVKAAGALMTQFSIRAMYTVAALIASGIVISWVQVESPANLLGNDYGTGLIRKLVLVAIILGLAGYNKLVLTPALERGDAGSDARIRRTIKVEYVVYVLILGAAMALTLTTPPRAIVEQGASGGMDMGGGFKATVQSGEYTADFDISPAKAGENMIMITVKGKDGQPLATMADLELVANLEAAGISDITVKGEKMPNGMWHIMFKDMIIPGEWTLRADAFVTDFDKVGFETKVQIK